MGDLESKFKLSASDCINVSKRRALYIASYTEFIKLINKLASLGEVTVEGVKIFNI